jgi:hypothetical protein
MKVQLTSWSAPDGTECASLTLGRVYEVLGIEGDWLRLINDRSEPVLYDPVCFRVVDPAEPAHWVCVVEDGTRYAYPPEWGRPGFFEDWHDCAPSVRAAFAEQLRVLHPDVVRGCETSG